MDTNWQLLGDKGGGQRGGPRRWTGNGPRPARHVPWPEIFKHHLAVLEGHHKMVDMIRKHTVEGSGNHRTICAMLDRTKECLRQAKTASREFVPPPDMRERVPIGSSSASMYPGYSPADIVYGQAASEFGELHSAGNGQSSQVGAQPDKPHYEIGQSKGLKKKSKKSIAQIRAEQAALGEVSAMSPQDVPKTAEVKLEMEKSQASTQPDPEKVPQEEATIKREQNVVKDEGEAIKGEEKANGEGKILFVIDTQKSQVTLPRSIITIPEKSKKRRKDTGDAADGSEEKKRKKDKGKKEKRNKKSDKKRQKQTKVKSEELDGSVKDSS